MHPPVQPKSIFCKVPKRRVHNNVSRNVRSAHKENTEYTISQKSGKEKLEGNMVWLVLRTGQCVSFRPMSEVSANYHKREAFWAWLASSKGRSVDMVAMTSSECGRESRCIAWPRLAFGRSKIAMTDCDLHRVCGAEEFRLLTSRRKGSGALGDRCSRELASRLTSALVHIVTRGVYQLLE